MSCSKILSKTLSQYCAENYDQLCEFGYKKALKDRNLWSTLQNSKKLFAYLDDYCTRKFKTTSVNVIAFDDISKLCQFTANSFGFLLNVCGQFNPANWQCAPLNFKKTLRVLQIDIDLRNIHPLKSNLSMPNQHEFLADCETTQLHKARPV